MNFYFTDLEKSAIINLSKLMVLADGKIDEEEKRALVIESLRIGVSPENAAKIENTATSLEPSEACNIISKMTAEEKKYVAALLGSLMIVDGNIDDTEMRLWQLVSTICNLPTMNAVQALKYMADL